MKHMFLLFVVSIISLLVGSCIEKEEAFTSPVEHEPLSPQILSLPTPEAGFGGVRGKIVSFPLAWKGKEIFAYFAVFVPAEREDEGFYYLEPSIHPSVRIENGWLQSGKIPPGRYVIVIGPSPQEALPIKEEERPIIINIKEGEIIDLGEIRLE